MRIPRRGLAFDNIVHHKSVTQCLGAVGSSDHWFMAVAAPDTAPPDVARSMKVFRIPPGVFVKLERSTWHAGGS